MNRTRFYFYPRYDTRLVCLRVGRLVIRRHWLSGLRRHACWLFYEPDENPF